MFWVDEYVLGADLLSKVLNLKPEIENSSLHFTPKMQAFQQNLRRLTTANHDNSAIESHI